jgi:hypothetical protein
MAGEVAVEKRVKISKYQQQMIGLALLASVVLGVCIVLSVFFIKYIAFNAKVIEAKDAAINDYETAIQNSKTLEGLVLGLADNKDLESVALGTADESCFEQVGDKKEKIDYGEKYRTESNEEQAREYLKKMKVCSALRVVPDALPAKENTEALMSSLDQIFKISNWEPEELSPSANYTDEEGIEGLEVIPVALTVSANAETAFTVLDNIEKSIRAFDISTATISWGSGENDSILDLRAQANAYYINEAVVAETEKTVYASDEARKAARGTTK